MTAYLIVYGADPTDRLAAYAFHDRNAAWTASRPLSGLVPKVPPEGSAGGCAYVIENEADVTLSGRLLVGVYNGLAPDDAHVNRFETRTVGVQRLLALLATIARSPNGVALSPPPEKEQSMPEGTMNGRGRKAKIPHEATITVTQANPYRAGTKRHTAFALYRDGMTAAEFLAAGGKTYDLNRAARDGLITVS